MINKGLESINIYQIMHGGLVVHVHTAGKMQQLVGEVTSDTVPHMKAKTQTVLYHPILIHILAHY